MSKSNFHGFYIDFNLIRGTPINDSKLLYKVRENLKKLIKHYFKIQ